MEPIKCAIDFCRLNANGYMCVEHQEEWQRSPEFRRSQAAAERADAHPFAFDPGRGCIAASSALSIHWTAVDDFARRLEAEKRNGT